MRSGCSARRIGASVPQSVPARATGLRQLLAALEFPDDDPHMGSLADHRPTFPRFSTGGVQPSLVPRLAAGTQGVASGLRVSVE